MCDHIYVYTAAQESLLMALIDITYHEPMWTAFEFRALDNHLLHSDDVVQAPRMLGKEIYVYHL